MGIHIIQSHPAPAPHQDRVHDLNRRRYSRSTYICNHAGFWQVRDFSHATIYSANAAMGHPLQRCKAFRRTLVLEMAEHDVCFAVAYLAAGAASNDRESVFAETESLDEPFIK